MVMGVADDLHRLRWFHRLAAQILASLAVIYVGDIRVDNVGEILGFPTHPLGPLAIPLTVVAIVGVINAVNMADGVDGLAGSVALVTSLMLACAALYAGNIRLATGLALVAGALCGFLIFNLRMPWNPRARIFLGNAGSELLGLFIACACIRLTQNGHHPVGVQIAPFLVAPLLIDCLTLMLRRIRMGVSPFMGDRNHLHHMLLDAGVSPNGVVGLMASCTLLIGVLAAIALKVHVPAPWFSAVFVLLWAAYFMATRRREKTVARLKRLFGPVEWLLDRDAFVMAAADVGEAKQSA
jgi:UDP-GlcNAc:undecaprenyl-phosphate GlcNAc-1-phosphate transferase